MRNLVSEYASQFRQDRQKQIRLGVILAALAVLVAGVVFWQLHNTGVAMTNEVFCGQEEHIHDDACYEELLVCDSEDEDHVHNDSCYETVLTCQIPEHTHTVECLIDETADVETAGDWEATLPEKLSGTWADDVVAIAESQVGYTESEQNFQLAEDGETHQGYTRYGAWYGNEYGDWDAMFVSFCLNYAGVPEDVIPENSGAWALSVALDEEGLYIENAEFTPEAGDLVFFDQDEDGRVDTVGIVTALDNENEDEDTLTVIEGNSSDAVEENTYEAGDETIIAFAVLPEQPDEEEMTDAFDEQDADVNEAGGKEEGVSDDAAVSEIEEDEETVTLMFEGEDYSVSVIYGADAELPEDTELVVSEYDSDSEVYEDRYAEAADLLEQDGETLRDARLFDISLISDGEEVEPEAQVEVKISFASQADAVNCSVVHFSDETLRLDGDTCDEDEIQTISFMTDCFSDFMVVFSDYSIMTMAAEQGKLEIYKYDGSLDANGGYFEGYYVWVPNGEYRVVYDTAQNLVEDGVFFYVKDGYCNPIEGEDGWYEAEYHQGSWQQTYKDEDEGATSSHGSAAWVYVVDGDTLDPNGSGEYGSYVFLKFDDNTYHDEFDLYLILNEEAPYRLNGENIKETLGDYMYKFEEFQFESSEEGALSGAVFTMYGEYTSQYSADYQGYFYFEQTTDDDGNVVYIYRGYMDIETPDDDLLSDGYTFFLTTDSDGFISIENLPTDTLTLTLHEVSAPEGYELMTEDIVFEYKGYDGTLDDGSGTVSVANESEEPTVASVDIYKYDVASGDALAGATFYISKYDPWTDPDTGESGDIRYGVFIRDSSAEGNSYIYDFWSYYTYSTLVSDENGMINIENLALGTYTLTEIAAPDGYKLLDEPIEFTVNEVYVEGIDDEDGHYETVITIDSGPGNVYVTEDGYIAVGNGTNPQLPNTGGMGTWIYTVTGLALIGGAGALLVSRKRRAVRS